MIPFKEIQEARGGCPDCDGRGEVGGSSPGLVEILETLPCPTCNGSGNGTIKHWQKIDVPNKFKHVEINNFHGFLSVIFKKEFKRFTLQKYKPNDIYMYKIPYPHKVGDTINETCGACGGEDYGFCDFYKRICTSVSCDKQTDVDHCNYWSDCPTCDGNPKATLTCQKIEYRMKDGEHFFYTEWREL